MHTDTMTEKGVERAPRVITPDASHNVASIIALLPLLWEVKNPEAILCFTGEGERHRVPHAVELWQYTNARYLLIAGNSEEVIEKYGGYDKRSIKEEFGISDPGVIVQTLSKNTLTQAIWFLEELGKLKSIDRVVIVSAWYHIPRCFLSFLRWACNRYLISLSYPLPNLKHELVLLPGEMDRIQKYQEKGDIATLDDLLAYLKFYGLVSFEEPK